MQTFQLKILGILGEIDLKIGVYLARLSSFWKFLKMLFHSLLEVDEKMSGKDPALTGWNIVKDLQFFFALSCFLAWGLSVSQISVHPQHLLFYCTVFFRAAKLVGLNVLQLMNENTAG